MSTSQVCLEEFQGAAILIARAVSLKLKGNIIRACVRSSIIYGSETWPMKVEDRQRLERADRMMVRRMYGVTLTDVTSCEELRQRLGKGSVSGVLRRNRLRWLVTWRGRMMMTDLKHVREWRLLVGEVETGERRRGENLYLLRTT